MRKAGRVNRRTSMEMGMEMRTGEAAAAKVRTRTGTGMGVGTADANSGHRAPQDKGRPVASFRYSPKP